MRVGIVGLGYVGLTLAIAAANKGIEVYGIEINPKIKQCLKDNRAHFYEPGLDDLIKLHNGKNFHCIDSFSEINDIEVFIITVGTPLKKDSKLPNFAYIKDSLKTIGGGVYDGSQLVILRSTVSVGTTRNIVIPVLSELCGKEEVLVGMCPERTVEGKAIEELTHLPQIISGNNENAIEMAKRFFLKITNSIIVADSLEEAELVKLYCNTYRDINFAIGNAFCLAAQTFGVDGTNVIKRANEGYKRAGIALPGFVAGPCLEKDSYILTTNMVDCMSRNFILDARKINESLENEVVNWVQNHIGTPSKEKIITLSGMAFKGQPVTSDLRGSSSVNIAIKLEVLGYKLRLHDFAANSEELSILNVGEVYDDLTVACADSRALIVLNNHINYSKIQLLDIKNDDFIILDVWNVCQKLYDQFKNIYTLGNMNLGGKAI